MILSHTHQFIFVKTRKVAGTSVEIALSPHLGPIDVATPIAAEDEVLRHALGGSAQNHRMLHYPGGPERHPLFARFGRRHGAPAPQEIGRFTRHMGAADIRAIAGAALWDRYFTFTIERNPFEAVISGYFYAGGPARWGSVGRWIREDAPIRNATLYCIDGTIAVDLVLRYERLQVDLPIVARHLGFTLDGPLPHAKAHYRTDRRPWMEILTVNERRDIERIWSQDLAIWESLPRRYGELLRTLDDRARAAA